MGHNKIYISNSHMIILINIIFSLLFISKTEKLDGNKSLKVIACISIARNALNYEKVFILLK